MILFFYLCVKNTNKKKLSNSSSEHVLKYDLTFCVHSHIFIRIHYKIYRHLSYDHFTHFLSKANMRAIYVPVADHGLLYIHKIKQNIL